MSVILLGCLLSGAPVTFAGADGLDLSVLETKQVFAYSDETKTDWSYYSVALVHGTNNETIQMVLASWGKGTALTHLTELRFFITDQDGKALSAQKATVAIDSNFFEISLWNLDVGSNLVGTAVQLTQTDEDIVKSLASGSSCKLTLQCGDTKVQANLSAIDLEYLKSFALDMLRYDFLHAIDTGDETTNEEMAKAVSLIKPYVYKKLDRDVILANNPLPASPQETAAAEPAATEPVSAAPPYEWDCPECERKGNTGNYCGGCGHAAPWVNEN